MTHPPQSGQEGEPPAAPQPPGPDPVPAYGTDQAQSHGVDPAQSYWSGVQANPYTAGEYYLPAAYAPTPAVGYPTPGYGYGYGAPYGYLGHPPRSTDGMAIASLVLSCSAVLGLCFWGVGGLPLGVLGGIFGHVAKSRIKRSGAGGDGLALAGIIVGWITAGLALLAVGAIVTLIILDDSNQNY